MPPQTQTAVPGGAPSGPFGARYAASGGTTGTTGAAYDPFKLDSAFAASQFIVGPGTPGIPGYIQPAEHMGGPGGGAATQAQYVAGVPGTAASTAVVSDFLNNFGSLNDKTIEQWQTILKAAGFSVKPTGVTDPSTRSALEEAIREAQQMGLSLGDLLNRRTQSIAAFNKAMGIGAGAKRAPFVAPAYQPMSEAALDAAVESGAQATVGRSATQAEETAAEGAITGIEKKAYAQAVSSAKAAYAGKTPAPETQYGQADVQQAVAAQISKAAPTEAAGVQLRTALQGFLNAVKAG